MPWVRMIGESKISNQKILLVGLLVTTAAIGLVETDVIEFQNNGVEPVETEKERKKRIVNFIVLKTINSVLRFLNLKGFIWK